MGSYGGTDKPTERLGLNFTIDSNKSLNAGKMVMYDMTKMLTEP
jgi:hypothetical protein